MSFKFVGFVFWIYFMVIHEHKMFLEAVTGKEQALQKVLSKVSLDKSDQMNQACR